VSIIIWLLLDVVSTVTPVPPVICLNCSASVVLLTANTADSCPTKFVGVSSKPRKVNLSPSPSELYNSLKLSLTFLKESLILSPVPSLPTAPTSGHYTGRLPSDPDYNDRCGQFLGRDRMVHLSRFSI
jgi:hypothetical protein